MLAGMEGKRVEFRGDPRARFRRPRLAAQRRGRSGPRLFLTRVSTGRDQCDWEWGLPRVHPGLGLCVGSQELGIPTHRDLLGANPLEPPEDTLPRGTCPWCCRRTFGVQFRDSCVSHIV